MLNYPSHGQKRIQQRGLSRSDIDLVTLHGTETRDGYYLRDKDVRRLVQELQKKEIIKLNDLAGTYAVVKNNTLITAYHPNKKKQKRIFKTINCCN